MATCTAVATNGNASGVVDKGILVVDEAEHNSVGPGEAPCMDSLLSFKEYFRPSKRTRYMKDFFRQKKGKWLTAHLTSSVDKEYPLQEVVIEHDREARVMVAGKFQNRPLVSKKESGYDGDAGPTIKNSEASLIESQTAPTKSCSEDHSKQKDMRRARTHGHCVEGDSVSQRAILNENYNGNRDPMQIPTTRISMEATAREEHISHVQPGSPPDATIPGESSRILNSDNSPSAILKESIVFKPIVQNLYEAMGLRPNDDICRQWIQSWRPALHLRLRMNQQVGKPWNLGFAMIGSAPDLASMKPTILIICKEAEVRGINGCLEPLAKLLLPSDVAFMVVPGNLKLSSGESLELVLGRTSGENLGRLPVWLKENSNSLSILGAVVCGQDSWETGREISPSPCTVGGVISIGKSLYALTVAHSLFYGSPGGLQSMEQDSVYFGHVHDYQWEHGTNGDIASEEDHDSSLVTGLDWMLLSLHEEFLLPNTFSTALSEDNVEVGGPERAPTSEHTITGYVRQAKLSDGEIWVCGGITGVQKGYLNAIPSLIWWNTMSYDVLSVVLTHPLADGDSGAWVIRNNEVCGYLIARLDETCWGYMIPIQPVLESIACFYTDADNHKPEVQVPDSATVKLLASQTTRQVCDLLGVGTSKKEGKLPEKPPSYLSRTPAGPEVAGQSETHLTPAISSIEAIENVRVEILGFSDQQRPDFHAVQTKPRSELELGFPPQRTYAQEVSINLPVELPAFPETNLETREIVLPAKLLKGTKDKYKIIIFGVKDWAKTHGRTRTVIIFLIVALATVPWFIHGILTGRIKSRS